MKDDVDADRFIKAIEGQKSAYPDANLTVEVGSLGGGSATAITIDVIGGQYNRELNNVSKTIMNQIKEIKGIEKVTSNQEEKKPIYSIVVEIE
jgi:multidrug efflux pump subunit AcrB